MWDKINRITRVATLIGTVVAILSGLTTEDTAKLTLYSIGIVFAILFIWGLLDSKKRTTYIIIGALVFGLLTIAIVKYRAHKESGEVISTEDTTPVETTTISAYIEIGSIKTLGKYEQDNDKSNGEEEIQWIVLTQEGDEVLLVSTVGLVPLPYAQGKETSDWENSSIRKWLNSTFYKNAFSDEEKEIIIQKEIEQHINEDYPNCDQGNSTTDYVFLLSAKEYLDYMENNPNIESDYCNGTPSPYAIEKGVNLKNNKYSWWWLRTSSKYHNETACSVNAYGVLDPRSRSVSSTIGMVRPAIWIKAE